MALPAKLYYARADISDLKQRVDKYLKKYHNAMIRLYKDAAAEFVWRTVQEIHIDTGMSAASLEPLAASLGTSIIDDISPFIKHGQRNWGTAMTGLSQKGRIRSIDAGFRAGQSAFRFSFGSVKNPYFIFEFKINVYQYAFWEKNWQSLNKGLYYFVDFVESNYEAYVPFDLVDVINPYIKVR
ncbi:MAG TPA: hypothetical protein VMX17_08750 [Candidatus Glassbacteria bacterium]|nr:hypothetical protein [Candidatus Glassbacteria bacterium]